MVKKVVSSLPRLQPVAIYDTATGEQLSNADHYETVNQLIEYVLSETIALFNDNKNKVLDEIGSVSSVGSANSFARQRGYRSGYQDLPREIKAKSRINELVLHKFISEVSSYALNTTKKKRAPTFSKKINLGAVDKQMVSLSIDEDTTELSLLFKCWDKEYFIEFSLPDYIKSRNIQKWCLPTIAEKNGEVYYYFSFVETPVSRNMVPSEYAGIDLGRSKAFSVAVTNDTGARIAEYSPKGHVKFLNDRRERLLTEKKNIVQKANHYKSLGLSNDTLLLEAKRKSNKAMRLGEQLKWQVASDITKKLVKHNLNTVAVENLKWAVGKKYGSRWNFSRQQEAIEHSLSRVGIKSKRVNPKNTSQQCHKCQKRITHRTKNRTVWCSDCKIELDRDFNAALNLSKKIIAYPNQHSRIGNNCSSVNTEQVIDHKDHKSIIKKE